MAVQLKATRGKSPRITLRSLSNEELLEKRTSPATLGKVRQKIENELVRRKVSW